LAASYRYDPFGNTISQSGNLSYDNVYRFSSKEIHDNSGMYYYGYRFYDPNLQRWINRDPIGESGGYNLYVFGSNDPQDRYDTDGRAVGPPGIPPVPAPTPPPPPPSSCPGFVSQWPDVAKEGGKVGGTLGKAICCTDALRLCLNGCETEYGSASTLPARESQACLSVCRADCFAKSALCMGKKTKPSPKPSPGPKPSPSPAPKLLPVN